jgi:two-component system chemotaxis response regulator CheY
MPVLIVEKRITFARLIEQMLHKARFQNVESTNDGRTALEILQRDGPKIIMTDVQVEPLTWREMLQRVRADQKLASSPFIVTSEALRPQEARWLKNAGVDGVLLKPFKPDVLEPKLTMAFQRASRFRTAPQVNTPRRPPHAELGRRLLYAARKA